MHDDEFIELVLKEVQDACRKGGIERFETPQHIKTITKLWTSETGLVTDAFKLKRKAIEQKYKDDIDDLYEDCKPKQTSEKKKKSKPNTNDEKTSTKNERISNEN
ncbi:unnamed protein product [Rotaria sp. Silwood1]|nr:unnamed protein product [Rotaria sp. Silwood1]CAF1670172.1 unnamed protein product [Rotaria sp. Silwood1]